MDSAIMLRENGYISFGAILFFIVLFSIPINVSKTQRSRTKSKKRA
jgi:hypothetical protein